MWDIPAALITAQRQAPLAIPKVRIRITNRRGEATLFKWTRWQTGAETPNNNAGCVATNGAINRFWRKAADLNLYRQHIATPSQASFSGITLDGTGDYILETQDLDLTTTDFTWECGFHTDWTPTGTGQHRYLKFHGKGTWWLRYEQQASVIQFRLAYYTADAQFANIYYTITLTEGQRYHVAVVYDNNIGMKLYLDGAEIGSNPINGNLADTAGDETVGAYSGGSSSWLGFLNEVRLSNIRRYTAPFTPATLPFTDDASTLYLWHLEDGTGAIATDDNSVHGTLRNGSVQGNPTWTPGWTALATDIDDVACTANGIYVELVYSAHSSPYHLFYVLSDDYGATFYDAVDTGIVGAPYTRVALAHRANGDLGLIYSVSSVIYARTYDHISWSAAVAMAVTWNSQPDLAVIYYGDWNVIITAKDSSNRWGVWAAIFGDGYAAPVGTWSTPAVIMQRKATESYTYSAPSIFAWEVFRFTFVESYTGTPVSDRLYWSFMPAWGQFLSGYCLEPVPFNYASNFGADMGFHSYNVYMLAPNGVWHADATPVTIDITSDVVEIDYKLTPKTLSSKLTVVLDNTSNKYSTFDKLGYKMAVEFGYQTTQGPLYQEWPAAWITGWRFVSPPWFPLRALWPQGVIGTIKIEAETAYDLLKRWKTRRDISWAADQANIFQMISYFAARIGLDFSTVSYSMPFLAYYPEFELLTGHTGLSAIKKLLSWVEDVMFQRTWDFLLTKNPLATDAHVETYNTTYWQAHLAYSGKYGHLAWDPNRAEVIATTLKVEDQNWQQIAAIYDRTKIVTTPDYTTQADAAARAAAELRKGQMWKEGEGSLSAPLNCRIELWDVIRITDTGAGVVNLDRRIVGIRSYYNVKMNSYIQSLTLGAV